MPSAVHKSTQLSRRTATNVVSAARQQALTLADQAAANADPQAKRQLEQAALRQWQEARRLVRQRLESHFVACEHCNGAGFFVGLTSQMHTCAICEGAGEYRRQLCSAWRPA
jgi:hypothetical protein